MTQYAPAEPNRSHARQRAAVRRAVVAVTLSGAAVVSCQRSNTAPDRQNDATEQPQAAEQPQEAEPPTAEAVEPATPTALPRVILPAGDRAVDTPQRAENVVLPSDTSGVEAAPIRPTAPPPTIATPEGGPPTAPGSQPVDTSNGSGDAGPNGPLGEGVEFDPDVVEPRVDPDITACSPIVDGVCPMECTRYNDRDCCEVTGRGGVCSFDAEYGCRCAVIGPFNPPESGA